MNPFFELTHTNLHPYSLLDNEPLRKKAKTQVSIFKNFAIPINRDSNLTIFARKISLITPPNPQKELSVLQRIQRKNLQTMQNMIDQEFLKPNSSNNSRLHIAAKKEFVEIMEVLIRKGADLEAENVDKEKPLHFACLHGKAKSAAFLLKHEARVDASNVWGNTPLHLAALQGYEEIVEILLEYGANVDLLNAEYDTPLHLAAKEGRYYIVQLLLKASANPYSINLQGMTPSLKAYGNYFNDLGDFLLQKAGEDESLLMLQKMLISRFSLKTKIVYLGKNISLERFLSSRVYPKLIDSFNKIVITGFREGFFPISSIWETQDFEAIDNALGVLNQTFINDEIASVSKLLAVFQKGKIIALSTGWKGHATGVVIAGNFLIKCNRGEGANDEPGIRVFVIGNKERLNEALTILIIARNQTNKKNTKPFQQKIHQILNLRPAELSYLPHKDQTSENCAWASAKLVLKALFYGQLLTTRLPASSNEETLIASRILANESHCLYKAWTRKDRLVALKDFMETTEGKNLLGRDQVLSEIKHKFMQKSPLSDSIRLESLRIFT
jgi:ankyrin repeat protein